MAFIFYRQPDSMDCGPTCLQMVARHHGRNVSLEFLRTKSQIGKEGVNLMGISEAAESIGFRSVAAKLTVEQLVNDAGLPAILHWSQEHFVVLYKIKRGKFWIADPGAGLLQYTTKEFTQHWVSDKNDNEDEGVALFLEPTPAFYKAEQDDDSETTQAGKKLAFQNIYGYLSPHKKLVFQLLLGLAIGTILQLFLPFLTQSVVDTGINTSNIHFVYIILIAQLALFAGRMAIEFVRSWILLHISTRINLAILTDFLIKLMNLPVSFFDSKKTGDILQRMNDHQRIESFLTGPSLSILFSLFNLVVFSVILAMFSFPIFSVFMVSAILYSLWVILFLKKRKQLDYKRFGIASKEQGVTIQLVQGMQEIKLNGMEKPMRWSWERLQVKLFKLGMKGLALNQWQQTGAFFINEGKNIVITFLSAKAVIDGQITFGTMLSIQYMIGQLNSPIEQLLNFLQSWQNAKISIDRLNEIHSMEDEEPEHKNLLKELPPAFARQLAGGKNNGTPFYIYSHEEQALLTEPLHLQPVLQAVDAISFRNVSFTYPGAGNEPVLEDINLVIPKGKTTAIVGTSGSGKTTLLKMLLKFYEPQRGEIKIGNTDMAHLSHKTWRSHCGVVMQESFIFSDSIAKNIAVGQDKMDVERMQYAAEAANVRDFIESLPLGYNTRIGAEGNGISMGQRQRILIARAVYRNPQFIFFDEATNSLDANNESKILDNLETFFKGRTVLVVAHRLSTVKNADQIVVLNRGRITERGTHQELISLKGEYFTLVKNQLELGE
ncbi:MAG: peptidase domain-containing ABC transporter [Chitinophagaceae bacterium]|nr:peptidase domain-containing ABC transporter [Chitinophagaceae bacterium]